MAQDTIARLDYVLSRVNTHPEYSSCVAREVNNQLREDAERHSLDIEFRGEGFNLKNHISLTNGTFKRLVGARDYLATHGIDLFTLSKLGYLIEPDKNKQEGFRKIELQYGGFAPPGPLELTSLMDNLVASLEDANSHPVERASHAHLEMVRIHPYLDGNGRAARLLQDFCLQQKGYPAAVIPATDRGVYIKLINDALGDRYSGNSTYHAPSKAESSFREFIAGKVLHSAEFLDRELKARRLYEVRLSKLPSAGIVHTVASVIRGVGKGPKNKGVNVRVNKSHHRASGEVLTVVGDIGTEDLKSNLQRLSDKYGFRYAITTGKDARRH